MHRFTLTLGLALAAGIAIFLAPRLIASASAPTAWLATPTAEVAAPVDLVEVPAQVSAEPEAPMQVRVPRAASQIPELDAPPRPVVIEPVPSPDTVEPFWRDCPACGMG